MKYGYEDTDKKIEIELYGLKFEIKNLDSKNVEELRNIDKNLDVVESEIESILGAGAVEKINNKRIADGHEKMTLDIELAVLGCIFETYANATTGNIINRVNGAINNINDRVNNINNRNYKRRNYRRNYRRY